MLDRTHSTAQRALDGPRGISVRHDRDVGGLGLLGRGADFVERELRAVDPVGRRGNTAGNHQLQMRGTLADLLAASLPYRINTVADEAETRAAQTRIERHLARPANVAVAAGLRQRVSAEQQARTGDQSLLDGGGQTVIGAAGIAHRGEAAHQHVPQDPRGADRDIGRRHARERGEVGGDRSDMHMGVAQAGHQHPALQVVRAGDKIPHGSGRVVRLRRCKSPSV